MIEEWREIPGWPLHLASSLGRIKSIARWWYRPDPRSGKIQKIWKKERILKPQKHVASGKTKATAMLLRMSKHGDGKNKTVYLHHLILAAFAGSRPKGLIGCHNNGDPTDNRPSNLRWDTHKSNAADMDVHGTRVTPARGRCGAAAPAAKLTDAQIVEIFESPWGRRGIGNKFADRFGVGNTAIYEVRKRYAKRPDLYAIIKERSKCLMSQAT